MGGFGPYLKLKSFMGVVGFGPSAPEQSLYLGPKLVKPQFHPLEAPIFPHMSGADPVGCFVECSSLRKLARK